MITYVAIETLHHIKYLRTTICNEYFIIHTSFFVILFYEPNYDA